MTTSCKFDVIAHILFFRLWIIVLGYFAICSLASSVVVEDGMRNKNEIGISIDVSGANVTFWEKNSEK